MRMGAVTTKIVKRECILKGDRGKIRGDTRPMKGRMDRKGIEAGVEKMIMLGVME